MKSKKERPRNNFKQIMFYNYKRELKEKTLNYDLNNNSEISFELFQSKNNVNEVIDTLFNLAYFYDANFTGNKDFMHIPNVKTLIKNFKKYPIFLATQKNIFNTEDIIGATTVKFEKNKNINDNPFFPTKDERVLSITGVLSGKNITYSNGNRIKGIGRELYKSAIKGAYEINKDEKIRLICEIDCRNERSLNSLKQAVLDLQNEGVDVSLALAGYYEIINENKMLDEAPTFIFEILFNQKAFNNEEMIIFSFEKCKTLLEMSNVISNEVKEKKKVVTLKDNKKIVYHNIQTINAHNISLIVGKSAEGNDRIPVSNSVQVEYTPVIVG